MAHTIILFKNSKLLKFDDIYKLEVVKFIWQMLNSESPIIQFSFVADHHGYNLRNQLNLRPPRANLNLKKMWVAYIGCAIWNSIPERIQNSVSINSLKFHLKRFLFQSY